MALHSQASQADPRLTRPIQVRGGVTLGPERGELEADSIALDISSLAPRSVVFTPFAHIKGWQLCRIENVSYTS
jgi:hypothetical protein